MNATPNIFVDKRKEFMDFLRTRFSVFHESNVFFRDLHYGVMAFLKMNGQKNGYTPSEDLTRQVISAYELSNIFVRIDDRTWMLNYPLFRKPSTKPAPAAKPATSTTSTAVSLAKTVTAAVPQNPVVPEASVSQGVAG
jgi:hypothetical protein